MSDEHDQRLERMNDQRSLAWAFAETGIKPARKPFRWIKWFIIVPFQLVVIAGGLYLSVNWPRYEKGVCLRRGTESAIFQVDGSQLYPPVYLLSVLAVEQVFDPSAQNALYPGMGVTYPVPEVDGPGGWVEVECPQAP